MLSLKINLQDKSYKIKIGNKILKESGGIFKEEKIEKDKVEIFIITSPKIRKLHSKKLEIPLKKIGYKINFIEINDREENKNLKTYEFIISRIKPKSFRTPHIVTFGGGVISDIAGFAAGTYRRGIPYVIIPTTLLSQVDSSLGGKVAVDLKWGKNLLGLFYQPRFVLSDVSLLETLPLREIKSGLSEVIKYGIIHNLKFFEYIEKNLKDILNLNIKILEYIVYKSAQIKKYFVEKDERDEIEKRGIRAILNYGHTIGHAIESAGRYKIYNHGEAVALGMLLEAEISHKLGFLKEEELKRIKNIIKSSGLPLFISKCKLPEILSSLTFDKKFIGGKARFSLPIKIGEVKIIENVEENLIKEVISKNMRNI